MILHYAMINLTGLTNIKFDFFIFQVIRPNVISFTSLARIYPSLILWRAVIYSLALRDFVIFINYFFKAWFALGAKNRNSFSVQRFKVFLYGNIYQTKRTIFRKNRGEIFCFQVQTTLIWFSTFNNRLCFDKTLRRNIIFLIVPIGNQRISCHFIISV